MSTYEFRATWYDATNIAANPNSLVHEFIQEYLPQIGTQKGMLILALRVHLLKTSGPLMLTLSDIAHMLGLSERTVRRQFEADFDQQPAPPLGQFLRVTKQGRHRIIYVALDQPPTQSEVGQFVQNDSGQIGQNASDLDLDLDLSDLDLQETDKTIDQKDLDLDLSDQNLTSSGSVDLDLHLPTLQFLRHSAVNPTPVPVHPVDPALPLPRDTWIQALSTFCNPAEGIDLRRVGITDSGQFVHQIFENVRGLRATVEEVQRALYAVYTRIVTRVGTIQPERIGNYLLVSLKNELKRHVPFRSPYLSCSQNTITTSSQTYQQPGRSSSGRSVGLPDVVIAH